MELSQRTKHLYYLLTQGNLDLRAVLFPSHDPRLQSTLGLLETTSLPVRNCVAPGRVAEPNKCRDLASLI